MIQRNIRGKSRGFTSLASLGAALLFACFFTLTTPGQVSCQVQAGEYEMKAMYLKHIATFTDWPFEASITDTTRPFIIGVLGRNPFGEVLESTFETVRIRGKRVEFRYSSQIDDIPDCHLLFIAANTRRNLDEILAFTSDKSILTVSDSRGFAERGVHVNLYMEGTKLRFEINQKTVRESACSISSHLLSMARIVQPIGSK